MKIFLALNHNQVACDTIALYKDAPIKPNVLVSFHYLRQFKPGWIESVLPGFYTMLDSGAYSAYNSGKSIDMGQLVDETKKERWNESVALDVIGDAEGSLRNSLKMLEMGSPAFPVFHIGDPWEILQEYCSKFSKVGLSCRFGESDKESIAWLENCFAREWPKKFHSFGWIKEDMLMKFPFHSADASSWELGPLAYGNWRSLGRLSVRRPVTKKYLLKPEVEWNLTLQTKLTLRWRNEWQKQGWDENILESNRTNQQQLLI